MSLKQGHAESEVRPILTVLNAMKLAISITILMLFVASAGQPHPQADPQYERHLPEVVATAHAQSLSKPVAKPKTVTAPPAATTPAVTPPVCPDTQWIWADDGQCHDKPVAQPVKAIASAPVAAANTGCGDNTYANFIYMHESGCRTDAVNEIGACGIGQALPCGKMPCSLQDYACQNDWFTNYAMARYGSWAAAYDYWVAHKNW